MTATHNQGTHFWFLSIFGTQRTASHFQGTWTPGPGQTRQDVFMAILKMINEHDPSTRGCPIMSFDIQPNQL